MYADNRWSSLPVPFVPRPLPVLDVTVENHGSLMLFRLHTADAEEWVTEHVPAEAQFFGNALVVEPRYARDIADGMQGDGLVLQ
jgi:hypothetical protein